MKYVMAYNGGRGFQQLDDESTRESVSLECREAALSFLSGVAAGWDKLDLALWLTGPYARATRHTKHGERVADITEDDEIPDATIEELVTRVRGQLVATLEKAALDCGALEFADEAIERGTVRKTVDAEGRSVWVPVDGARMRLKDRIKALFVADYLNTPYVYAELFVCHRCEAVVFDEGAKRMGICGSHRLSGVVPRDEDRVADDTDIAAGE